MQKNDTVLGSSEDELMLESAEHRPVDADMNRAVGMSGSAGSTRRRILYVDGDEAFGTSFSDRLRRAGYECTWVRSCEETLRRVCEQEFDVVIADVVSSGDADLEGVRALQSPSIGLPVIIMVGIPSLDTAIRSVKCSVVGYLTKPPDCAEITRMIARGVERRRFNMNLRMAQGKMRSWVADFRALQQLRDCVPDPELLAAATRNLQLIADDLKDLLQGMNSCSESSEAEASARERTMKEALARTVQVLLQTRQNFKCKRLGELRADLSQLLDKMP